MCDVLWLQSSSLSVRYHHDFHGSGTLKNGGGERTSNSLVDRMPFDRYRNDNELGNRVSSAALVDVNNAKSLSVLVRMSYLY